MEEILQRQTTEMTETQNQLARQKEAEETRALQAEGEKKRTALQYLSDASTIVELEMALRTSNGIAGLEEEVATATTKLKQLKAAEEYAMRNHKD